MDIVTEGFYHAVELGGIILGVYLAIRVLKSIIE